MEALFEERTQHMALRFETLIQNEALNPWEKLCVLIDDHIARVKEKQQFYKIMIHEQILEKNSLITELLSELKLKNTSFVETIIKEGQKKEALQKECGCSTAGKYHDRHYHANIHEQILL